MLHAGYYIIGEERQERTGLSAHVCGNNKNHRIDVTMNFCPECGNKLISVIKDDARTLHIYDIPEEEGCVEDQFLFPEYAPTCVIGQVVGISNYSGCGHFKLSDDEILDWGVMVAEKERQYEEFMARHSHDIDLLRKYVYDNLEIKYGLFHYDF